MITGTGDTPGSGSGRVARVTRCCIVLVTRRGGYPRSDMSVRLVSVLEHERGRITLPAAVDFE